MLVCGARLRRQNCSHPKGQTGFPQVIFALLGESISWAATSTEPGPELPPSPACLGFSFFQGFISWLFLWQFHLQGYVPGVYRVLAPPAVRKKRCKDLASCMYLKNQGPLSESAFLWAPQHDIDSPREWVSARSGSHQCSVHTAVYALRESVYGALNMV